MSFIKRTISSMSKKTGVFVGKALDKLEILLAPALIKGLGKFIKWLDKRIKKSDLKKKRKAHIQEVKDMSGLL
jgi:hypothetical protein